MKCTIYRITVKDLVVRSQDQKMSMRLGIH